ncbi:MAG: thioredoxin fold domain-containing protein [Desulfuromonadales bacterium]
MTTKIKISRLVALAGSVLTLTQTLLLAINSDGLCFSDGCEIVDSLTTVPPIFFNIGGFLFFQAVFWGIWLAGQQRERLQYVKILLLAGLAAEGVLVSFQYFIAQAFCAYCLVVLALIVLLNVLCGLRHSLGAFAVFTAVILVFPSLQFSESKTNSIEKLDMGSYAVLAGENQEQKHFFFFSSTCKYCEKVIESLQEENNCTIYFNPTDEITNFALQRVQKADSYATDVNRNFLKSLGIDQIPVFLTVNASGFQVVKGEGPIKRYLQENCPAKEFVPVSGGSFDLNFSIDFDFALPGVDDSCSVNSDCDTPSPAPVTNQ